MVTYFALKLLEYLPGNRKIAVPAAILHDTGFYGIDSIAWKHLVASGGDKETEAARRPHQNRGILWTGRILERVNYPEEYHFEIADIIGDHDTRKLPTTQNGRIVRAADLIWKVTCPCLKIYHPDLGAEATLKKLQKSIFNLPNPLGLSPNPFDLGEIENKIAKIELVNTMLFNFRDEAIPVLINEYKPELDFVLR